jgi:hypothetical protein
MYDHEIRAELARDRFARLRHDWEPRVVRRRPARRLIGNLLIRAGERLAPEPCPSTRPRRELSSRA